MISVIIPCLNEDIEELNSTILNLTQGLLASDLEIIIVNDGSVNEDGFPKDINYCDIQWLNLKILNYKKRFGVGHSFDRGVSIASGDIIVLMGSDVYPEPTSWYKNVLKNTKDNQIGCSCSVGMTNGIRNINPNNLYSRYGAEVLFCLTVDDLPKSSELRKDPNYRDILEAKWLPAKPYEIPCPYGAFYFLTKEFYEKMYGFDTVEETPFIGHCFWGALEPFLALKMKVYGGACMMFPDFRVGHIFSRVDMDNIKRSIRNDLKWWNKLWVAHTMLDDSLRDELLAFPNHSLNFSQAKAYIKQNWAAVQEVRERNKREGKLISK
jgi:glycosyltransferase involved in cell wall biosynthesis